MAGFALVAVSGRARAAESRIVPAPDAVFELEIDKTGLLSGKKHVFRFERYQGRFDETSVSFSVEANSLKVLDDWKPASGALAKIREVTLGKDVLDAARFPEIRFEASALGEGPVTGQLTVRGVAKPCVVTVQRSGAFIEGMAVVKYSAFGIKEQKAALGTIGTKDEMRVRFRLRVP
ncbi:MAG: YceI family protein [Acidobacteria bacterium]|nr:YceI family protein [Acidobacteriota bacterium]